MLWALGSASCDITYEKRGTICHGHSVLPLVISHTRQGVRFAIRELGSASRDITHETGNTMCYRHWVSASCDNTHETRGTFCYGHWVSASCDISHETGGTICYGHWVLRLLISHTRQGGRFLMGIGFCVL